MPAYTVGRRRPNHAQSSRVTQIGMAEFISAAMPDGTPCWANTVKPLPRPHISTPVVTTMPMGRPASGRGLRHRSQPYSNADASRKRSAQELNGGSAFNAIAMAR